jgi:ATP-dependent DNA helicase RecQ
MTGDPDLFGRLKTLRLSIARKKKLPPYMIFPDRTLREMSTLKPEHPDDLLDIVGVGMIKRNKYGKPFLEEIRKYLKEERN